MEIMAEDKNIKKEQETAAAETEVEIEAAEAPSEENMDKKKSKKDDRKDNQLKKQIEELTDKLAKEKNDYLRLMAEFETFRRRSAEERLKLVSSAAGDTVKGLLPVLDDCERAMEILSGSSDQAAKEGTSLIYTKLMEYLKTLGLERIEAKGEVFNTDFHEAVTQIPAGSEEMKGKVIDVIQTGYTFNGKILRYAKVVVGA